MAPHRARGEEASGFLVVPAVFNTDETEHLGLAGSIPVRLRRCAPRPSTRGASVAAPAYGEAVSAPPDRRRSVPRTDTLLADPALATATADLGRPLVKAAVVAAQQQVRDGSLEPAGLIAAVLAGLPSTASSLRPVVNATGVLLHTNLGRAPLSAAAVAAITDAAGTTDVELDLATGRRARRGRGAMAALAAAVPDAGGVHVVGNGAGALVLAVTALAPGGRVVISRGEMVEIGDGFRLQELITSTGASLLEVGTTNRTHLRDYAGALDAVGDAPCVVLKVHPSNFRITGFTSAPSAAELATLCREHGVPLVVDIGSGLLAPHPALPEEPDAATALRAGADLVTASCDKLLGGPQGGLVLGRGDLVERARRHPLARALRVDKLMLSALEATLLGPAAPVVAALEAPVAEITERARRLARELVQGAGEALAPGDVEVVRTTSTVGGGGAPGVPLPSAGLSLPAAFAEALRTGEAPVVARVEGGATVVDLRSVPPAADADLLAALLAGARCVSPRRTPVSPSPREA